MSRLHLAAMTSTPPRSGPPAPPAAPSAPIAKKKRGGRQLRHVALSPDLKFAIRQFAAEVGVPRLMEPTGFRDFRGWLERVAGPTAAHAWASLVQAMLLETAADAYRVMFMKEEVVREIVRTIVVPRPGESAKLVSTNCGRQCARPRSGNTLMTILERILVEKGIVTPHDLELFTRDRTSPNSYVHLEYSNTPLRPPVSSVSSATYSPSRSTSMSLEAITSSTDAGPSVGVGAGTATTTATATATATGAGVHGLPYAAPYHSRQVRHMHAHESIVGSSRQLQLPSTGSMGSTALQGAQQQHYQQPHQHQHQHQQTGGRREDRLPSFQELQDSLKEHKR